MSLKLLQPGIQPLGQFDGVDAETLTFKGGEVCSLTAVPEPTQPGIVQPGFDQAAFDDFDGYTDPAGVAKRPAVSKNWNGTVLAVTARPLFLADDGIAGYGTLFGTVVGGTVGQVSYGPNSVVAAANLLGPHTATGSGKITCWDKPGLYAVSLDNVDTAVFTGLVPTNTTTAIVGKALGWTAAGLLTPSGSPADVASGAVVGHFVEFSTNGSLVTTPNFLVAALNSPSGNVSSLGPRQFTFATFYFAPPTS